jgi:hypothetical protein
VLELITLFFCLSICLPACLSVRHSHFDFFLGPALRSTSIFLIPSRIFSAAPGDCPVRKVAWNLFGTCLACSTDVEVYLSAPDFTDSWQLLSRVAGRPE